jgi:hypothetical protein
MRRKMSNIPPTSSNSEPGVRSFSHVDSSPASSCSSGSGSPSVVALDMAVASFALKTPGWLAQAGIRSELRCRWRARVDWPVSSCRGQGTQPRLPRILLTPDPKLDLSDAGRGAGSSDSRLAASGGSQPRELRELKTAQASLPRAGRGQAAVHGRRCGKEAWVNGFHCTCGMIIGDIDMSVTIRHRNSCCRTPMSLRCLPARLSGSFH